MLDHALTIRAATPHDADTLRRLAALDSRPQPHGNALLAECDGVPLAAIALTSGLVVADPFHPTVDAVHLLRHRRYRLLRQGGDVGLARTLLRRLAPASPPRTDPPVRHGHSQLEAAGAIHITN